MRCNYVGDIESGHKHSSHVISRRRALFLSFFHLSATVELLPTGVFSGDFFVPLIAAFSSIFNFHSGCPGKITAIICATCV